MFGSRSGSTSPCLPLRRVARSLAALLVGIVLPAGAQAATASVNIDLSTSVSAFDLVTGGCPLTPPPLIGGLGPATYSYGQTTFTTGATPGNHVFEVTALGAIDDPEILLYQGAGGFNPLSPAANLVACELAGGFANPFFPRLVTSLTASTTYTVVVIVPQVAPSGTLNATLGLGLEPTITYANKSVAVGAIGESMTATSNSTGGISYTSQFPLTVADIHPTTGALSIVAAGSTQVAAIQAAEAGTGTYGSGVMEATLTVTSASLASQTITFANPGAQNFGTSPTLNATAAPSGLTVSFSSSTTGVCTITAGGTLTFVTAGTCTIAADQAGNVTYAAAPTVTQSFTVNAVVPGAPTIGTATAGNAQASVAFTAPASNGGAAITGYTVTASPGPVTMNGTASPITVTGLANGTPYTFTVTAANSAGPGPTSASSNSVTPAAPAPCAAGTQGAGGVAPCTACSPGTYQPATGQTACIPAPAGSFVSVSGATAAALCPVNTFSASTGATACTACAAGLVAPTPGSTSCTAPAPTLSPANIVVDNRTNPHKVILTFSANLDGTTLGAASAWTVTANSGTPTYSLASVALTAADAVTLTLVPVDFASPATYISSLAAVAHIKVTPPATLRGQTGLGYAGGQVTESGATHLLASPILSFVTQPNLSSRTSSSIVTSWKASATGGVAYVETAKAGSAAPTADQIVAGTNPNRVSGAGPFATTGADQTATLSGLVAGTAYDIYAALVNWGGDSTVSTKLSASTAAPDYCSPNPCLNGGICTNSPPSYFCTCTAGFAGVNCQTPTVGPKATLAFITEPAGAVADTAFTTQPRVAIQDAFGRQTADTDTIALAIKSGTGTTGAALTCTSTAAVAGVATFTGCKIDKAGTGYVLTATSGALTSADSTAFGVAAPPATAVTGVTISANPTTATSATTITVGFTATTALVAADTITVKLSGYTFPAGAVTVTAGTGVTGTLTGAVAAGALDTVVVTGASVAAGTRAIFTLPATNPAAAGTIAKAGLTVATSKDTTPVASANDIVITPRAAATATKLVVTTPPPSSMTAGTRFSLAVSAMDSAGNIASEHRGTVTIAAQGMGGSSSLKGSFTANFVAGVASLPGLYFQEAGTYTLLATSAGLTSAQSPSVVVTRPAVASYIAITSGPAFEVTGTAFGTQPVVKAYAADGRVFTSFTGTVTLTASPATGTTTNPSLSPAAALTATFVSGVATFSGVRATAATGSYVLTVTSGTLSASTTFNVYADATSAATARVVEQAQSRTFTINFKYDSAICSGASCIASAVKADLCDAIGIGTASCARVTINSLSSSSAALGSAKSSPAPVGAAKVTCPTEVTGVGEVTVPPCAYSAPGTYRLVGTSPGFPARTSNPFTVVDALAGNLPGAPQNLRVEVGDGQAVVSWDPPETTGAGRIVAYEVFGLRDGSADQSLAKGLLTSKTLKLANGSEWRFGVKALNSLGGGEMARSDLVRIGAASAARKVVAGNAIGQAVSVESAAVASLGASLASSGAPKLTVGGCTVRRAETVAVAPDEGPGTGAVMPYGATGLELTDCPAGVANVSIGYPIVVQDMQVYTLVGGRWTMMPPATPGLVVRGDTATFSVADNGPSDADPQVGVISLVAGAGYIEAWLPELPGAPQNVTTTPGAGSVMVSWLAPATGGTPVRYRVTAFPGGASCVADAPATSCIVTGLTAGVAYTFTVVAENATGAGSASAPSVAASPLSAGAVPVPTLGEYARFLLALLLLLAVWFNRDRLTVRR